MGDGAPVVVPPGPTVGAAPVVLGVSEFTPEEPPEGTPEGTGMLVVEGLPDGRPVPLLPPDAARTLMTTTNWVVAPAATCRFLRPAT